MRDAFAFKFKGVLIQGSGEVDRVTKLLVPDSIEMSNDTLNFMNHIKETKEYYNFVDELCMAMDRTGMFADEVFSIHITN